VPPIEDCRLPLNVGLFPVAQLARSNVDDPPPSLHDHYSRFISRVGPGNFAPSPSQNRT
jgi:hypothetical protein